MTVLWISERKSLRIPMEIFFYTLKVGGTCSIVDLLNTKIEFK